MSDAAIHPPVRIVPLSSTAIDAHTANTRIEAFLDQFQQRSTPLNGGDATVPAQLSKLRDALHDDNGAVAVRVGDD